MFDPKCLLVVLTSLACLETMAVPIEDRRVVLSLKQHMEMTKQFLCNKPQPRYYRIKDSLPEEQRGLKEKIIPSCTVVNRCDEGAGCCNEATVCVPNPANITTKFVEVQLTNLNTGLRQIRNLSVEEHGSCICGTKTDTNIWPVKPPSIRLLPVDP